MLSCARSIRAVSGTSGPQSGTAAACRSSFWRTAPCRVQVLTTLGDPAPGPGTAGFFINDFEPGGLNNHGEVLFGADLGTTSDPSSFVGEAVYLRNSQGNTIRLASPGSPAPGGGTFESFFFGPTSLNDPGDAAISFQLSPFMLPFGVNTGMFRYSHSSQTLSPVVIPFVTPAPTGGVFQGALSADPIFAQYPVKVVW